MHRVLERRGWRLPDWWALPKWEREEYLAYEEWRASMIAETVKALTDGEKYTPETHAMLLLARL